MTFLDQAQTIHSWTTELRREVHRHPELAYKETRTCALICKTLTELGIEHKAGYAGGTGVIAEIGDPEGPCIALRADMDALPLQEETGLEFASETPGIMHGCGHDTHVAMLLGAARLLKQDEANLPGRVRLIFQPAEEGSAGGKLICEEGALKNPEVSFALALHSWPMNPTGTISLRSGPALAAASRFDMLVRGEGGHGAMPHTAVDPIVAAASIITALQTIVSRERDPLSPNVVSVTSINTAESHNVIPAQAELKGTYRAFSQAEQDDNAKRIREIAIGIGSAHRCQVEVDFPGEHLPPTVNHADAFALAQAAAADIVGKDQVLEMDQTMGGEDFSYYTMQVPCCFATIGVGTEDPETNFGLHHPRFTSDENALPIGVAMHLAFVARAFEKLT